MIGFFIVAALLVAGALLFVVPPLLGKRLQTGDVSHGETNLAIYRDQIKELDGELANGSIDRLQHETARREIERRVLEEVEEAAEARADEGGGRWTLAVVVAAGIPLVAIPLYLALGSPQALNPDLLAAKSEQGHALTPEMIAQMVGQLKQRLADNPDDAEGWAMLAKTSAALGRYEEAAQAYAETAKRFPPDAQLLADYADTLAMARGRSLIGEPEKLIDQALRVDPRNVKALALGGTIAFQKQEFAKAATLWKRILEVVPPDSDIARRITSSVADAEAQAGGKSVAAAPVAKPAAAGGVTLAGALELSDGARQAVSATDTVFIFARAASGPKMPLAIVRLQVKDLPTSFKLDESMAMAPGMSIGKFPELVVGARVSKSGSATPAAGDWESALLPAKPGASDLKLVVDRPRQ